MERSVRKYEGRPEKTENRTEDGAFLELFIVLVVLGVLAAIAIPNLDRLFH